MKVRLTKPESELLVEAVKHFEWLGDLKFQERGAYVILDELTDDEAIDLRDLCSDYLMEIGFDRDYKPNDKGQILENLIDKLFFD